MLFFKQGGAEIREISGNTVMRKYHTAFLPEALLMLPDVSRRSFRKSHEPEPLLNLRKQGNGQTRRHSGEDTEKKRRLRRRCRILSSPSY